MNTPTDASPGAPGVDAAESYCAACNQSFAPEVRICPNDGGRLIAFAATRDELVGRILDERFEVKSRIGRGGMGTVYRAIQLSIDREVALKVIHPKLASDRAAVKRFLREARLASRLNQTNIVNVIDFGQTADGTLYLAMELLRGQTLATVLGGRRIPPRRAVAIALQLCDALDAAHAQGIVHRDLKPTNIVVLTDPPGRDVIKVLDFGLAKSLVADTSTQVTNTDAILGTPLYMSPEQVQGKPSDPRSDLYALGCIVFEMLTGAPPFVDEAVNLILARHLSDPPPPLPAQTPAALRTLVARLLAKAADDRPDSAAAVRAALSALHDSSGPALELPSDDTEPDVRFGYAATMAPDAARSEAVAEAATATRRRPPWQLGAVAGAAVACAVIGLAVLSSRGRAPARTPAGAIDAGAATAVEVSPADAAAIDAAPVPDAAPLVAPIDAGPDARPSSVRDAGRGRAIDAAPPPRPIDAAPPPRPIDAAPPPRPIDADLEFYVPQ